MRYCTLFLTGLMLVLILFTPSTFSLNTELPDSPAGIFARKFLKTAQSNNQADWQAFAESYRRPTDDDERIMRRVEIFQIIHDEIGKLELYDILSSEDLSIELLLRVQDESAETPYVTIGVQLDSLPPHGWDRVSLRPADDPTIVYPTGELTKEKIASFLDEQIDKLIEKDQFSGTVLVAKNGQPVYTKAAGEACKRYGVANRLNTKFNIGSMNKMFTGVAVCQLVEQGKLSFDDYVGKYLPEYPNEDVKSKVKIHHLLTHTGGTGDYFEELFDSKWWEIKSVQGYADLFAERELLFEPGDHFEYSNAGPIILGLIIEKISGMSYYEYIRTYVTGPAGMPNTDCYEVDYPEENLAIGYTRMDYTGQKSDRWYNNLFMHAVKGGPAGGGYSTVEDLLAFDRALRNNTLLSKESFELMTTAKTEELGPGFGYAYLFGEELYPEERIIGHNGGAPGINAVLSMLMESGYTIAVCSNYDNGAIKVGNMIQKLLVRENG